MVTKLGTLLVSLLTCGHKLTEEFFEIVLWCNFTHMLRLWSWMRYYHLAKHVKSATSNLHQTNFETLKEAKKTSRLKFLPNTLLKKRRRKKKNIFQNYFFTYAKKRKRNKLQKHFYLHPLNEISFLTIVRRHFKNMSNRNYAIIEIF